MLPTPLNLHSVWAQTPKSVNLPSGGVSWKVTTLTCCSNSSMLKLGSWNRSDEQLRLTHVQQQPQSKVFLFHRNELITLSLKFAGRARHKKTLHLCRASEIYTLCIVFRPAFKCSKMKDCWLTKGKTVVTERPWNKGKISEWMTSRLTAHNCPLLAGLLVFKTLQISFQHIKEYKSLLKKVFRAPRGQWYGVNKEILLLFKVNIK